MPPPSPTPDASIDRQSLLVSLRQLLADGDELDRCNACRLIGACGLTEARDELVARLRDEDVDVCIDAAAALGRLGDPSAVAPLVESLRKDPDGEVHAAVAEALGRIGGDEAVEALVELLGADSESDDWDDEDGWDSHWDVQRHAVQALGRLRAARAVPVLAARLDDEDGTIDEADLTLALARIGGEGEALLLKRLRDGAPRERRRAAHALADSDSRDSAQALGRALQDSDPAVRATAAESLARRGETRYLGALQLLLRDADARVRETALAALLQLTEAGQLDGDALLPLLADPEPRLRAAALQALPPESMDAEWQERLRPLLQDPSPAVVAALIPRLAPTPEVVDELSRRLADPAQEIPIRQQAARALGRGASPMMEILDALQRAASDAQAAVCWSALQALMELHRNWPDEEPADSDGTTPRPLDIILATLRSGRASESMDEAPTETIADLPMDDDRATPRSTLEAITQGGVRMETGDASPFSAETGEREDPQRTAEATEDLAEYHALLDHQRRERRPAYRGRGEAVACDARLLAARVLGECDDPAAVAALAESLRDGDPALQREAADALARLPDGAPGLRELRGPLASLLHLGEIPVRIACARALGRHGGPGQLPMLTEALADDSPLVRHQAVLALTGLLDGRPVPRSSEAADQILHGLSRTLADVDPGVRQAAAQALGGLAPSLQGHPAEETVSDALLAAVFLDHGHQARDMGHGLATLHGGKAVPRLLQTLAQCGDSLHRGCALTALEGALAALAMDSPR